MEERHVVRGIMAGTAAREETSERVGTTSGQGPVSISIGREPLAPTAG